MTTKKIQGTDWEKMFARYTLAKEKYSEYMKCSEIKCQKNE
jgi:hypothetical protein